MSMEARRTAVTSADSRSATSRSCDAIASAIWASISTFWDLGEMGRTASFFSSAEGLLLRLLLLGFLRRCLARAAKRGGTYADFVWWRVGCSCQSALTSPSDPVVPHFWAGDGALGDGVGTERRAFLAGAAARFPRAVDQNWVNSMGLTYRWPKMNRPDGSGVRSSKPSRPMAWAVRPAHATNVPSAVNP